MLLTLGTGALDAIAILALGDAFASVMTGNLVLAGLAIGTWSSGILSHVLAAILGYIVGGSLGSFVVAKLHKPSEQKIWPPRVTIVLTVQFFLILGLAIWWIVAGGQLSEEARLMVLLAMACAMGMQGAAMRAIGVTVSTTYMTGALTILMDSIVTRRPFTTTDKSALRGLLSLVIGAVAGGYLAKMWLPMALIFPTITLGSAVVIGTTMHCIRRD